jgi:hypothetical protein
MFPDSIGEIQLQKASHVRVERRSSIALSHCLAASAVLHLLLGLPFLVHAFAEPPEEPPVLVVDLQGAVSDIQTEQEVMQDEHTSADDAAVDRKINNICRGC